MRPLMRQPFHDTELARDAFLGALREVAAVCGAFDAVTGGHATAVCNWPDGRMWPGNGGLDL
jgi:hypothetical protein